MNTIRELLSSDPLANADTELKRREGLKHFSKYFPSETADIWYRALFRFVDSIPWRYWDPEVVDNALKILESSGNRTITALSTWSRQINIGFDNLFRQAPTSKHEENLLQDKARDLLRLATEFHPEYLRCAQHIFANLLITYWAVLRKGSVQGKFDLRGAVSIIQKKRCGFLLSGYDDRIRNAIAHGEVIFKADRIQYGSERASYELPSLDFLAKFDSLWRTSNALAIALLLFLARNKSFLTTIHGNLPPSIITFIAAGSVERTGLKVLGVVESELPQIGKRLHIAVQTIFRSREMVLLDSARIAMNLFENGATDYTQFMFEIDHGETVSSLVSISPKQLEKVLKQDAPIKQLNDIFMETQLLWYDESIIRRMVKTWKLLLTSNFRLAWEDVLVQWNKIGFRRGEGRYYIRKVENASVNGIGRIRIIAVLRYFSDTKDREIIKEIIHKIIKKQSKKWINTSPEKLNQKWGWFGRPKYVWVSLYKIDGTLRWLSAGGWIGGNLLAIAEKIYGSRRLPIFVPKPEEIWQGIRFRFSIDKQAAKEAANKLVEAIIKIGNSGN